jgi:hypothetical protein
MNHSSAGPPRVSRAGYSSYNLLPTAHRPPPTGYWPPATACLFTVLSFPSHAHSPCNAPLYPPDWKRSLNQKDSPTRVLFFYGLQVPGPSCAIKTRASQLFPIAAAPPDSRTSAFPNADPGEVLSNSISPGNPNFSNTCKTDIGGVGGYHPKTLFGGRPQRLRDPNVVELVNIS